MKLCLKGQLGNYTRENYGVGVRKASIYQNQEAFFDLLRFCEKSCQTFVQVNFTFVELLLYMKRKYSLFSYGIFSRKR